MKRKISSSKTKRRIESLKTSEFIEVLEMQDEKNRENLFIAGIVDEENNKITLFNANFKKIVVPLSIFKPSGSGENICSPVFQNFSIIDFGHTLKFGKYEASSFAVTEEVSQNR